MRSGPPSTTEKNSGVEVRRIHVDKGYRGHNHPNHFRVWITGQARRITAPIKRETKRCAAIEPVIGHVNAEHRMGHNGDRANASANNKRIAVRRRARGDLGVGISDRGEHLYPAWHMIDEDAIRNRSGTASPSRCAGSRRDARVSRHHPRAARDPQIATRGLFDRDSWLQERDDETRSATRRSTVDCSRLNRGLPFDGDYVGKPMLSVLSA